MWRTHTCLVVIFALAVSSLFASQGQQLRSPVNCPKYSVVSSVKTSPLKSKAPVFKKQNTPARLASTTKTNGTIKLDSIIEVSSDITTNQIWTAGNTYHVANDISVQALLVIEPGTTVEFAYNTSMSVNNGGVLISCGTPDNPIIYTSDSATPDFGDYYCPIYIGETASSSTKVTYSYIEYAYVGIFVNNNRLDSPIENNYLYYNSYGIAETGTALTDIQNNLLYYSDNAGIDVNMASDTGHGDAGSSILIANNTCDSYQNVGILVSGVANSDEAGDAVLSNNIVSQSYYYGIALVNGYMVYTLANTGYYGNATDTYDTYTNETNPVVETTMPYVTGTGVMPYFYLNPNSVFVNASDEYIEQTGLIGKTTDTNGFPDSDKADLGFHYPNWYFSNAGASNLTADFDNSYTVDFNDLSEFANYWLYDYNDNYNCWSWDFDNSGLIDLLDFEVFADNWLTSFDFVDFADFARYWRRNVDYKFQDGRFDLNGDGFVNFEDFAMFADQWRQTTESTIPPIAVTISGDPNNLAGEISIGISGRPSNIEQGFICLDGELIGYIDYRLDPETTSEYVSVDTQVVGNGHHEIKAVTIDSDGLITVSPTVSANTNNSLYHLTRADNFTQGEDYHLYAMSDPSDELRVELTGWDGVTVWTSSVISGGLNLIIPASAFTGEIYDISIEAQSAVTLYNLNTVHSTDSSNWGQIWSNAIAKNYDPEGSYRVQIFLPNGKDSTNQVIADCRKKAVAELVHWSGGDCAVWYRGAANWKTFSTQVTRPNTEVVYIVSHGFATYNNNSVNRLNFLISSGGLKGWFGGTDYVFSHKDGIPGADTDSSIHSLRELGLSGIYRPNRFIVYHAACVLGKSSEMANEWLSSGSQQIYFSFPIQFQLKLPDWQLWDYQMWNQWCNSRTTFSDALDYCRKSAHNPSGPYIYTQLMELGGIYGDIGTMFN